MISRLDPNADGNYTGSSWNRSSGVASKYTYVDDGAAAVDSDYLYIDGSQKISFGLTDLPSGAISPTSVEAFFRKTRDGASAAGPYDFKGGLRSNGTDSLNNLNVQGFGTYSTHSVVYATDPSGGGSWAISRVNGLEVLGESQGLVPGENLYLSYVKVDVTHEIEAGGFVSIILSLLGGFALPAELWKYSKDLFRYVNNLGRFTIMPHENNAFEQILRYNTSKKVFILGTV